MGKGLLISKNNTGNRSRSERSVEKGKNTKRKEWLVCIDCDGCLLDNMELKHKECFTPALINVWNLQSVSRYARQEWERVNLYSRTRGTNRFYALPIALEKIYSREEVKALGLKMPDLTDLKKWVAETPELSARSLREYAELHPELSGTMKTAAEWSAEVDANIRKIVRGIRPFVNAVEALEYLNSFADVVVVSATPSDALRRELADCGVLQYFKKVYGQDEGTKSVAISKTLKEGYDRGKTLKIGDAYGDLLAAGGNEVLFYPVIPSLESESWALLRNKYADLFKCGDYTQEAMEERIMAFLDSLPV